MSNVIPMPGTSFEDVEQNANELMRILECTLPKKSAKERAELMMAIIDILEQVPMGEFLNLRNATQDFQRMNSDDKAHVRSRIRVVLTQWNH